MVGGREKIKTKKHFSSLATSLAPHWPGPLPLRKMAAGAHALPAAEPIGARRVTGPEVPAHLAAPPLSPASGAPEREDEAAGGELGLSAVVG